MNLHKKILAFWVTLLLAVLAVSCNVAEDATNDNVAHTKNPDANDNTITDTNENAPVYSSEKGVITEYAPAAVREEINIDIADEAFLADIDSKAEMLRQEILGTKTEINLEGKTVYYISNSGNDTENDGLSPESSFATVSRANVLAEEGDVVLLKRGDLFRGRWTAKAGVTYSAYGEGEKPKVYGNTISGADPSLWTLFDAENNIWRFEKEMIDSGAVILNEGEEHGYKEIPTWNIPEKKFVLRSDETVDFVISEQLDNDLDFFCDAKNVVSNGIPQVSKSENIGYLYMRSDRGNPGEVFESVEFNPRYNCISVGGDNVTIDNLCVKYTGSHGIGAGTVENLTVTNCEFGWIGGGIQYYDEASGKVTRYGNAVEIYGGCKNYTVDHCYIYQSYDAGITHQIRGDGKYIEMFDIYYTNNLLEYNTYNIEYFLSRLEEGNKSMMKNLNIKNNIMRFSGYGWGEQRPDKGSAAHIKGWSASNPARDYYIEENIFDRALHMMYHIGAWDSESLPELKNNVYIQEYGKDFGVFGVNTNKHIPYDYTVLDVFSEGILAEETAEILFTTSDETEIKLPNPDYTEYISYLPSYSYTTNDGYTLPFRVITPPDYSKDNLYPVVLYLGSEYQRGNDNQKQLTVSSQLHSGVYNSWLGQQPINAIIIAPQCPKDEKLVNVNISEGNYTEIIDESAFLSACAELLPKALDYFNGDTSNVAVIGYSQGGSAAFDFAVKHPEMINSIVSICGTANIAELSKLTGKNVYMYHGALDDIVLVENARAIEAALVSAGANVAYKEYKREMHDCWTLSLGSEIVRIATE